MTLGTNGIGVKCLNLLGSAGRTRPMARKMYVYQNVTACAPERNVAHDRCTFQVSNRQLESARRGVAKISCLRPETIEAGGR